MLRKIPILQFNVKKQKQKPNTNRESKYRQNESKWNLKMFFSLKKRGKVPMEDTRTKK